MSSSHSCESELRRVADELHKKAYELEQAADALATLRDSKELEDKISQAKEWAKSWLQI